MAHAGTAAKRPALSAERHRITIVTSVLPGRAELVAALEAAAWANTRWFLKLRERGIEPPCCAGCAGLLYDPDRPAVDVVFATSDALLAGGKGSCGELVAFDVGRQRADVIWKGGSPEAAARIAAPDVQLQSVRGNAETWHAVERTGNGTAIVDVSATVPTTRTAVGSCNCGGDHHG